MEEIARRRTRRRIERKKEKTLSLSVKNHLLSPSSSTSLRRSPHVHFTEYFCKLVFTALKYL
jgi:hypothetical protein